MIKDDVDLSATNSVLENLKSKSAVLHSMLVVMYHRLIKITDRTLDVVLSRFMGF